MTHTGFVSPKSTTEFLQLYNKGHRQFSSPQLDDEHDLSSSSFEQASFIDGNFTDGILRGTTFSSCSFKRCNFNDAQLEGAVLSGCVFDSCVFRGADLERANLAGTTLDAADFSFASLYQSNLEGAFLHEARFIDSDTSEICVDGATLGRTLLMGTDVTPFCRAKDLKHEGPSIVDWRSITHAAHEPNLSPFLRCCGYPAVFVEYSISSGATLNQGGLMSLLQSVFISFGEPDRHFASKLNDALKAQGVRTFFFHEHATPGQKLHRMMRAGVNEYDKVVFVCSAQSLDRAGLMNELEEVLSREAREGGEVRLIPVRLDDAVFEDDWAVDKPDVRTAIRDRVIANFNGWSGGDAQADQIFQDELSKLLSALKKAIP